MYNEDEDISLDEFLDGDSEEEAGNDIKEEEAEDSPDDDDGQDTKDAECLDEEENELLDSFLEDESENDEDDEDNINSENSEDSEKLKSEKLKKKKKIIKISLISFLAGIIIAASVLAYYFIDKESKSYIMTFDDTKISVNDFEFFLKATGGTYGKDDVIEMITDYLVYSKMAEDKGISLTDEEKDSFLENAKSFRATLEGEFLISDERIAFYLSIESLCEKLYDSYIDNYVIDENGDDFKKEYANYLLTYKPLKYVITETKEKADEAESLISSGSKVDDIIKSHSIYYSEGSEIQILNLNDIKDSLGFEQDTIDQIMSLKVSEASKTIDLADGSFAVFIAVENTLSDDEVKEAYKSQYAEKKALEILQADFEELKDSINVKTNQKVYDTFK